MKNRWIECATAVLLVGLFAFGLFASTSTAQAAEGVAPIPKTPSPRETLTSLRETLTAMPTRDTVELENLLKREQLALNNQQERMEMSHTVAQTTQEYIDSQKSSGKATSSLENALQSFNQAIIESEQYHTEAASVLAVPAGFDAGGRVTDTAAAIHTLRTAGQSLRQAHLTITSGTLELRQAVNTYLGK